MWWCSRRGRAGRPCGRDRHEVLCCHRCVGVWVSRFYFARTKVTQQWAFWWCFVAFAVGLTEAAFRLGQGACHWCSAGNPAGVEERVSGVVPASERVGVRTRCLSLRGIGSRQCSRSVAAGFCAAGLFSEGGFGCERRCRRGGVPARDRWRWLKAVALRGEGSVKRTRVDRLRGAVWVSLLRQQRLGHLPDPAQVARGPDPRESSVSEPVPAGGREAFVCGATHRLGEGPPGPAGSWGHKPGAAGFYRTEGNRRLCRPNEARSAK